MISFTVYGRPQPQGSTRAFIPKGWKRAVITTDNAKLKPWRQQVSQTALEAFRGAMYERDVPVVLTILFCFQRPASAKKRVGLTVKPDIDKLVRATLDALTGIGYVDDAQVVEVRATKEYDTVERVEIHVDKAEL